MCVSKISIKYALAKLHLINLALDGSNDPIKHFLFKYSDNIYFRDVIKNIKKVKRFKDMSHNKAVNKLGASCRYPGTFNSSIHSIMTSKSYKSAILKTIRAGGCNCSRSNFIGAYFAALKGKSNIPQNWIRKCFYSKSIINISSK